MIRFKACRLIALGALLLGLSAANVARAGYTIVGTTPGGGNVIVGNGNITVPVGPFLSGFGFNSVTLNAGTVVNVPGADGITFSFSNDTLLNNGTITGAAGFNAVTYASPSALNNETIINNGVIQINNPGGYTGNIILNPSSGNVGHNYSAAIGVASGADINNIAITANGSITGGGLGGMSGGSYLYGNNSSNNAGGNIATGIAIDANTSITSLLLTGNGPVNGGSIGGMNSSGGLEIYLYCNDDGSYEAGANIATGIAVDANTSISSLSLTNNGPVNGGSIGGMNSSGVSSYSFIYGNNSGDYEAGANIATGIAIGTNSTISSLSVTNNSTVNGGSIGGMSGIGGGNFSFIYGNNSGDYEAGANIATGIAIDANKSISPLSLTNNGTVNGGSIGGMNSSGGSCYCYIYGNTSGDYEAGGNIATGIAIDANTSISSLLLTNKGTVNGGSIGGMSADSGGSVYIYGNTGGDYEAGGNIATGIAIGSNSSITGLSLTNNGSVNGGSIGGMSGGSYIYGNDGGDYETGGNIATGIAIGSYDLNTGLVLVNTGPVTGGSVGNMSGGSYIYGNDSNSFEVGGNIATGVAITAFNSINGATLVNLGTIAGGSIGNMSGGSYIHGNGGNNEVGGNIGTGLAISSMGSINGFSLANFGTISGGSIGTLSGGAFVTGNNNGSDVGGDVLSGVAILSGVASTGNNSVLNFGTIQGGNSASGNAGIGIVSNTGNLTINNWGAIKAGSGLPTATQAGFPAVAISVQGSNNTINLNGHSSVNGTLQGANGANNVLNLNFTGLSPAAIANVKGQLAAQGYPGSNDFTGTFTVRGVTYYVDPLIINLNLSSYQLQGFTPNQAAIGANLDGLAYNPAPGTSLFNLLNAIDQSGNVPLALEALSPQKFQIFGDIAEAQTNGLSLTIDARLNNLRDGSESIDAMGATDKVTTAGYDKDGKNVVVPDQSSLQKRWGFFAQGEGLFGNIDGHAGDLTGANFTTGELILGVDGKVNDHLVLGLLFNYDYTTASLDAQGSTANVRTLGGGVYAGYHNGNWYGNGIAAFGSNTYDSTRNITFPGFNSAAQGNTDGDQESVNIDGGYDFHITDKFTVGPLAGLQYMHLDVNSFNEAGAGAANLSVGSQNVDSLRSRLGIRADYHTQIAKEVVFAVEARAAWQHEFLDDSRGISGAFIGSGLAPFTVQTTNPQRDAAVVGVGVNFTIRDRATLYFDYDAQAGQQSYLEQSVRGGIKVSF